MRPGEGERRAIGGFYAQYRVSASLILAALGSRRLKWIRLADPEAGRVDDLQIGEENRVDAFQVKWAQHGGNFSFRDLTSGSGQDPSLIAQLADGWKHLREGYPSCRVVVHLVTNQTPSTSDKLPSAEENSAPRYFAAFLEQAWNPARAAPEHDNLPSAWEKAWENLRSASGLSEVDFYAFIRDCELEFRHALPSNGAAAGDPERNALLEELRALIQTLFETVADPQRIIKLDRAELLSRLGWEHRFEFRNRHEFPVDDLLYQPIEASVQRLANAIDVLPGGYLAILGSPGSGKSTMLTQTLRLRSERVIRYYAFVPDDRGPTSLRGESTSFLHDLTLALDRTGFGSGAVPPPDDRTRLLSRLHEQLERLGEDFRSEGKKTLILVDGLDHIDREQHPNRSLLEDLPAPEQVPEGVYFILGSQTDAPFPSSVQHVVRNPERRIWTESLSREAVMEILERADLSKVLNDEQKRRVHTLSDGHPLALMYLLRRLQEETDPGNIDSVLDNTERYEGSIERQYYSHWMQLQNDDYLTNLLGLLARLRGVIDLDWVESWTDAVSLRRLRRTMSHYFRVEDGHRWYFFHNSFRLFLLRQTAQYVPGNFDDALDCSFHRQLADKCAQAPRDSYWAWEELYHRFSAEEHERVLQLASQEWFRRQFLACRPLGLIKEDIRMALRSAAGSEDTVALARLVLVWFEIDQRKQHLETPELANVLLRVGEGQVASEHVRNGRRLLIGSKEGLRASVKFAKAEFAEEAQRIFELAEPLDLLSAESLVEDDFQRDAWELLESWACAAVHFLSIDELVREIRRISTVADIFDRLSAEEATDLLQTRMLFAAGLESVSRQNWNDVSRISDELYASAGEDPLAWFWLRMHVWKDRQEASDQDAMRCVLTDVIETIDTEDLDSEARVFLAEGVYCSLDDEERVRELLAEVPQPGLVSYGGGDEPAWDAFLHRFRLHRLLYALDNDVSSEEEAVPDAPNHEDQPVAYFQRALVRLARVWGEAWHGRRLQPWQIEQDVSPLLRMFGYRYGVGWSSSARLILGPNRARLYTLAVDAVAQHGPQAVEALRRLFEREWDGAAGTRWPNHVRREVILALYKAGTDRYWVINRLEALEGRFHGDRDVYGRVEDHKDQLEAWLTLEERERSRATLRNMLVHSLGVGSEKDYQMNVWVRWLDLINGIEPGHAAERIAWFSRAIVALETEGATYRNAAHELLKVTFKWSPRRAVALFRWFIGRGIVRHEAAVRKMLEEALHSPSPPIDRVLACLENIILPIADGADTALAELLVERTAAVCGDDGAVQVARSLTEKVRVYALDSTRSGWLYGVSAALMSLGVDPICVGIEPVDVRSAARDDDELTSRLLKLRNGSATLDVEEVSRRVSSPSDVRELLAEEAEDSYFSWEPVVVQITLHADQDAVRELAELFVGRRREAQVLAALSRRMQDLGNANEAWSLGMKALEASYELGWDRWYDGGSRLHAFGALAYTNPGQAHRLAFATLVQDLTGKIPYPQNFAYNLDQILPLLASDVPVSEVWLEVGHYLDALMEGSTLPPEDPDRLATPATDDTAGTAVADLVTFHLLHPVENISRGARRALGELLLREDG